MDKLRQLPLLLLVGALLAGCNLLGQAPPASATPSVAAAALTVEAVLTRTGPGIAATGVARQTQPVLASPQPSPTPAPTDDEPCDNRAAFIDDVTVRDNSQLDPGETFVKIWRLRNTGSCTWTPAYLLSFFGGNRLNAPDTVSLSSEVAPDGIVDLAVDMKAPAEPGTYQGYWKLRTPDGEFFGIGPQGDQSFWVKIVVPAPPTSPSTATATSSPTATEAGSTSTPTSTPTASSTATPSQTPDN
ncbi:MAG TPA: NBR1-Ig-like domain-containing protein [Anaerolineales bacterium]|jgi:hypothetical protein